VSRGGEAEGFEGLGFAGGAAEAVEMEGKGAVGLGIRTSVRVVGRGREGGFEWGDPDSVSYELSSLWRTDKSQMN